MNRNSSQKRAIVFNEFLSTLGGGERQTLDYALALTELGYATEILTTQTIPEKQKIIELFGDQYEGLEFELLPKEFIFNELKNQKIEVFVNQSSDSLLPNPAELGIYSQMFPFSEINKKTNLFGWCSLATYHLMLCNSTFTLKNAVSRIDFKCSRMNVLNPPISTLGSPSNESELKHKLANKKKEIIHVGRFNPSNHNKNQLIVIQCFLEAAEQEPLLQDWTLRLVGNVNQDSESQKYFHECLQLAERSNGRIQIHSGISLIELNELLEHALFYVHATGAFHPAGSAPEKCEHFGLSILEAAVRGCIPVVYARGGVFDYLDAGESCLTFSSMRSFVEIFRVMPKISSSEAAWYFQRKAWAASNKNNFSSFKAKLEQYIQIAEGMNH